MRFSALVSPLLALAWLALAATSATAGTVCSDMDGDGTAETCIETKDTDGDGQDDQANFPGQPPPEVPDPGAGTPSGPDDGADDDDGGSSDDEDDDSGDDE